MILDHKLKNLKVGVKVGGSLVSHRVLFSEDEKFVYVVSGSKVNVYSSRTGLDIAEIQAPNADTIANIAFTPRSSATSDSEEDQSKILILLTKTGLLVHVDCSSDDYNFLTIEDVNPCMPKDWAKISEWINMVCVGPERFLVLGRVESPDQEIMLYYMHRHLPGTIKNKFKKTFFEYDKIGWQLLHNMHSVCFGGRGNLVAGVQEDSLFVMDYANRETKWHKSGTRKFTCVAAHPTEMVVATGDDSGRILIWNNIFEKSPTKSTFHWHTLPVGDLCFSVGGTQMFSGGGECTLINWNVQSSSDRKTVPRMGLPIRHITVSPQNNYIAVSHADNCIQLVNSSNQVTASIQNITQCYIPEDSADSRSGQTYYRAGLHLDPRTNCLVMNGKPGHLQCYSFRDDKHLYNLDITQQNYITDERKKVIRNTDITQVAFSKRGKWLATGETLSMVGQDGLDKCSELRLKFWEFDKQKQRYVLNTSIEWPHENGMECLKIQEIDDEDLSLMAATSGEDKLFKTWGIVSDSSTLHDRSSWWNCENAGSYRNLDAGPLGFSRDGSVLAVGFGHSVCLWNCDNHEFKGSMSHAKLQDDIKTIEFGCHMSSHLVICGSQKSITVWDVITLMLTWTVPFEADCLAVDPLTNTAAAFSSDKHVFFFRPEKPHPIAIHKNVSRSTVVGATFVPNQSHNDLNALKSSLVFINSSQELCVFLPKGKGGSEKSKARKNVDDLSTLTPFTQLIPERRVSDVKHKKRTELVKQPFFIGHAGSHIVKEIMDASPHTMPSVTFFCDQLLASVSVPRDTSSDTLDMEQYLTESFKKKRDSAMDMETDDESDGETGKHVPEPSPTPSKTKTLIKQDVKPEVENEPITSSDNFDLDAVSSGNIEWIENIFSS